MKRSTIMTITALTLVGTMAFAARPDEGRGERQGRGEHGQRGDRLAKMTEALQLSDAQVDAIKQMHQAGRQENKARREQEQLLAKEWVALKDAGDTRGAEKVQKQLTTIREEMQIRHLAQRGKFEEILTPEQKEKLEQLKSERGEKGGRRGERHGDDDAPDAPPEQ